MTSQKGGCFAFSFPLTPCPTRIPIWVESHFFTVLCLYTWLPHALHNLGKLPADLRLLAIPWHWAETPHICLVTPSGSGPFLSLLLSFSHQAVNELCPGGSQLHPGISQRVKGLDREGLPRAGHSLSWAHVAGKTVAPTDIHVLMLWDLGIHYFRWQKGSADVIKEMERLSEIIYVGPISSLEYLKVENLCWL